MEDEDANKPDAKEGPQLVHVQCLVYISIFSRFTWTIVKIKEKEKIWEAEDLPLSQTMDSALL